MGQLDGLCSKSWPMRYDQRPESSFRMASTTRTTRYNPATTKTSNSCNCVRFTDTFKSFGSVLDLGRCGRANHARSVSEYSKIVFQKHNGLCATWNQTTTCSTKSDYSDTLLGAAFRRSSPKEYR